jgi:eukaryotic-like serine/threonine-protein kinase
MLAQACQSLAEAHDAGLYHRDIKPPNLFLCRAADEVDIVKLLDFGIVQTVNEQPQRAVTLPAPGRPSSPILDTPKLTQVGAMLGTPGFMAPEQILGMQIDGRADLYALGCVAWWLLAGGEVFSREGGESKVLHRHIYDQIPDLRARARGWIPQELVDIVSSMLAKDPNDRPIHARVLAQELRAIFIPDEYAWTEERAQAWWRNYSPPAPVAPLPSAEVQVIMPRHSVDQMPKALSHQPRVPTITGPASKTKLDSKVRRRKR